MIQDTSLLAFKQDVQPTLGERQRQVLTALGDQSLTNNELAHALGWEINRVTPRMNELVKLGKVELDKRRPCRITGRTAIAWRRVLAARLF